jgi:hypothetical protein
VPDNVEYEVPPEQPLNLEEQAETMLYPGAHMSTHCPKFEKYASPSVFVMAPTVIALGAAAGDVKHELQNSFPAATLTTIPASIQFCIVVKDESC